MLASRSRRNSNCANTVVALGIASRLFECELHRTCLVFAHVEEPEGQSVVVGLQTPSVSFFPSTHNLVGDLTELSLSRADGFDCVLYWHDK